MTRQQVVKAATAAAHAIPVNQKYTLQSTGIWERIRRIFALVPERSTGVPINAQYRTPNPGALPPQSYDDPVTLPAADIADNPYWKRDTRRNYPRPSVVNQADVAGLLTVGSKAAPRDDVLQIGDAGQKQLVAVKQEGEGKGVAAVFERDRNSIKNVLDANGLPPLPVNLNSNAKYQVDREHGYPEKYTCRTFV
ncbi:hypothetical protein VTN31DRAFT_904 [Thermomyces dupontii]|uniref:uncharacterized protein n=1 Tax=Talaromyces thermophilus TaxID=28565 RepID=UPI0037449DB6